MSKKLNDYLKTHQSVIHTTFDPYGPGVVRIHMVPPERPKAGIPWAVILNGQDVVPLNTSWAVLLSEFVRAANAHQGHEVRDEELKQVISDAVAGARTVFPSTKPAMLKRDLAEIVDTICDIAAGRPPKADIGSMSLAKYAPYMRAPHRMDLMVSAMTKDGAWHCNQKCLNCYAAGQTLSGAEELSTEQWKTIIRKCREACIPQLTFTGGEPTMRDDLPELVAEASWFVTRLNTNGIRLTKDLCRELRDASLDAVQVTLYSAGADIHNRLVGAERFSDTVRGIENALEAGLNLSINTPLCSLNPDYRGTLEFAGGLGVRYASSSGLILTGAAAGGGMTMQPEQLERALEEALEFSRAHHMEVTFTSPGWLGKDTLARLGLREPACGACLSNMAIAPDGSVVPCQSWLSDGALGNLLTDRWSGIWKSERCREIRKSSAANDGVCPLKGGVCE